jgi:hypothetical protein
VADLMPPPATPPSTPPETPPANTPRTSTLRTSDLLLRTINEGEAERISIGDLIDQLGDRAFGILLLISALPNCVPMPPGTSTITAVPLLLFSIQIVIGSRRPWLPAFLRRKDFSRADMQRMILRVEPWLKKFERLCKPRLTFLVEGLAERLAGIVVLWLSLVLVLPIFLGNFPPGFAIAFIALALMENDGLLVLAGHVTAIVATIIAAGSVAAQLLIAINLVHWLFGSALGF